MRSPKPSQDRIHIQFPRPSQAAAQGVNQMSSSQRWAGQLGTVVPMRGQGRLNQPSGDGNGETRSGLMDIWENRQRSSEDTKVSDSVLGVSDGCFGRKQREWVYICWVWGVCGLYREGESGEARLELLASESPAHRHPWSPGSPMSHRGTAIFPRLSQEVEPQRNRRQWGGGCRGQGWGPDVTRRSNSRTSKARSWRRNQGKGFILKKR